MKKTLILGILLAVTASLTANDDVKLLKEARDNYYKSQKQPAKAKADNVQTVVVEEVVVEDFFAEDEKPAKYTQLERLEATAAEAADKVDFYQRVVRSVAREEKELAEYHSVIRANDKKNKKTTKK